MINDLPTVFEVVTERKHVKNKSGSDSGTKSKMSTKVICWIKGCISVCVCSLYVISCITLHPCSGQVMGR